MAPFLRTPLTRPTQIYQLFGANTSVGKTVVSTTLCSAIRNRSLEKKDGKNVLFLKPVSTGPMKDSDELHIGRHVTGITTKCLYAFDEPVSPHLAARGRKPPTDSEICAAISTTLADWTKSNSGVALVETAGGVLSPGPSGSLQADLYRPLRLPAILVADPRLGGISSTISAYESLFMRGYDVEAIVVFEDGYYRNHEFLSEFAGPKDIPLLALPQPPVPPPLGADAESLGKDKDAMTKFYAGAAKDPEVLRLLSTLENRHVQRIERLESMAQKAKDVVWYPFTQHHAMTPKDITVIDSAHDDCYQTLKTDTNNETDLLQPSFDGSASWWTQGLGHGNASLALQAAHTAGRYGHVIFAGTIHEPALSLSELLLKSSQNPRLQKVFFTDNGSTGMEVAVKMALRPTCNRYGWDHSKENIEILGLKGSYHGDTIGVMDCSEPSVYNTKVEWYRGRGHWFDFPVVKMVKGQWKVEIPGELREALGEDADFGSLSAVFNLDVRKNSRLAEKYKAYIKDTLEDLVLRQGRKFGALIIEPIILGAGGMLFSDPLFQHSLVQTIRENPQIFSSTSVDVEPNSWSGLPIVFDEVFTGLYRLGRHTPSSFLQTDPDIVVNAKLLTGGLLPLCTTMASNEIFEVFNSPEKSDALLHGHSYTANPVGCGVAEYTLRTMVGMEQTGYWEGYKKCWELEKEDTDPEVWSSWSPELVKDLSLANTVDSVFALGSVLSITLRDQTGQGGAYCTRVSSHREIVG